MSVLIPTTCGGNHERSRVGLAFVPATAAALAGVAERETGLASGLSNTALQIGGALGVAILPTVAVSRSDDYLAANDGANPLVVLNEGFQCGLLASSCRPGSAWRWRSAPRPAAPAESAAGAARGRPGPHPE